MGLPAEDICLPSKDIAVVKKYGDNQKNLNKEHLCESPIYDEEQMRAILDGIAQNIWQKMDARNLKLSALSDLSTVPTGVLSKIFNYKTSVSLKTLIKLAFALEVSPIELFPYDLNRRKTNGDRFEEITNGLDVASVNYLLEQAAGYAKLRKNQK